MTYVYFLQSQSDLSKHYVGISDAPARRLEEHNGGASIISTDWGRGRLLSRLACSKGCAQVGHVDDLAELSVTSLLVDCYDYCRTYPKQLRHRLGGMCKSVFNFELGDDAA